MILFCLVCFLLSGCGSSFHETENETQTREELGVWFFACSEDADSILLRTKEADIMIDTGEEADGERLIGRLKEIGVEKIDLLILTHPDKDHIGGAAEVLAEFPVERAVQTSCEKGSALQMELGELLAENPGEENVSISRETQSAEYGKLRLTLYPPREEEYENSNNYSIGVLAEYEGITFFFAGDAKKKRIKELLLEDLPQADVYKAAYHGRDVGASEELIKKLRPVYAVVTAGQAEKETQKAFLETGTIVYSTYENEVHFTVKDGILDVG